MMSYADPFEMQRSSGPASSMRACKAAPSSPPSSYPVCKGFGVAVAKSRISFSYRPSLQFRPPYRFEDGGAARSRFGGLWFL